MKLRIGFLILGLSLLFAPGARAQIFGGSPIAYLYCQAGSTWSPCNAGNPLQIAGSFSASGFPTTQTTGTPISVMLIRFQHTNAEAY